MTVWPILHYDDTSAALRFLVDVLGFTEEVAARDDDGDVVHAEVSWPGGGRLVFGGTKHVESVHGRMRAGSNAVYVVTDDVAGVYERARAAGASVLEPPQHARFGSGAESLICTIEDPEGNLWTFGTYR
ncbi:MULTISPECIES: VOC family protein [Amycolatopsis]|uniref:VOC family protein n=1 Tax=Amycolatopsis tucumanensis TaxID=401106 RepID=A0ABP7ILR4_9PSEU|nr:MULTISPECIES: VOC family protein [Amycolatopsis]MCF6422867.1 VOC family protein [Amycolatopsis tucumanensis]